MAVTRINNNQVTDAQSGNLYVGINAGTKLQNYSITATKIANNLTYGSNLTITGNLTVQGNTTAIDTTITTIEDPILLLGSGQTGSPTVDIGYIGQRGSSENIAFVWDESAGEFITAFTSTAESNTVITITSYANLHSANTVVGGNLTVAGTTSLSGNIISALNVTGNITGANITTVGLISSTGTVTGGNLATGGTVSATGTATVGNVATGGTVSATGTITGGNINTAGNVSATGNVTAANFFGNVSGNLVIGGGNTDVLFNDNGLANSTAGFRFNKTTNAVTVTGTVSSTGTVTGGNLATGGTVSATGDITGANVSASGNVIPTANVTYNLGTTTSRWNQLYLAGPVHLGNLQIQEAGPNVFTVTRDDGVTPANFATGPLTATGNVTGGNLLTGGLVSATGDITGAALSGITANIAQNATVGNLVTNGIISATGTITGGFIGTAGNISATGNVTSGNIRTAGLLSATGTATVGNVNTGGTVSASGTVTGGNLDTGGTVSATGNISTNNFFLGNGAFLTGVTASAVNANALLGNTLSPNVLFSSLTSVGTLTDLSVSGTATTGNLATGGTVSATGTITGGNLATGGTASVSGNVTGGNILTGGLVSATGNITGANVNTAQLYSSSGLSIVNASGNINIESAANVVLNNKQILGLALQPAGNTAATSKFYVDQLVTTAISYHQAVVAATNTTLATATGGTITYTQPNGVSNGVGAYIQTTGTFTTIDTANVQTVGTRILVKDEGNAVFNGIYVYSNATAITRSSDTDTYGPASANTLSINDYFFVTSGNVNAGSAYIVDSPSGTITFGTSQITFAQFSQTQVYTEGNGIDINGTVISARVDNNTTAFDGFGNISVKAGANLTTPNIGAATGTSLSTTGTITGGNLATGGTISGTGTITGGNVATGGTVSATGTATAGNLATGGTISGTGNVTGGNILTGGIVSATGNITTAGYYFGNGFFLAGVANATSAQKLVNGTSNVDIPVTDGNVLIGVGGTPNVAVFATAGVYVTGVTSATGTATVGNLATGGTVSAGGNITGANIRTTGAISATGAATVGNLFTGGTISATGTITGGNLETGGTANVSGTVTGGNLATGGTASATGTVTGGNLATGGTVSAAGTATVGNLVTGGVVSAIGTVTGGNIATSGTVSATGTATVGNLGTGGTVSSTGNILTSANVSATGNVFAANFFGNISGNLSSPGADTQVIFNDNGTANATSGFTFNKTSNTVTVGANVNAANFNGNVFGTSVSASGTVTAASTVGGVITGTSASVSGTVTAASTVGGVITGSSASVSGNITGANLALTSGTIDGPAAGRITINGSDIDTDFAVDGDTLANVFYVDAGTGTASFGSSTQVTNAIVNFDTTTSFKTPVGNTAQRPATGVTGMFRFNTTTDSLEVYDNTQWTSVGVPAFTVITDQQFNGDGSTVSFTLTANATTAGTIVSINGVQQIPITAYSVSGVTLLFTEAPAPGDLIDVRNLTTTTTVTTISNSSGNASVSVSDSSATVNIVGDLEVTGNATILGNVATDLIQNGTSRIEIPEANGNIHFDVNAANDVLNISQFNSVFSGNILPAANVTYDLGTATRRWKDLYLANSTIYLGNAQISANATAIVMTNPAGGQTVLAGATTSSSVAGNITGGNVLTGGIVSATGNITGSFFIGNGSQLTGIDATSIQSGTSNVKVLSSGGNIAVNVAGSGIVTFTSAGIINNMGNAVGNIGNSTGYFNTIFAKATSAQYADLAEKYAADADYAPGTVVMFGGSAEVTLCVNDGCSRVAGVISTNPSYRMNDGLQSEHTAMVALTGRVPTSVTGTVRKGDMMVSAGNGTARAEANPQVGTVIGKALADSEGDAVIEVVVGRV